MYIYIRIHIYICTYPTPGSRWCNSSLCPLLKYHSWEWLDNYLHLGEDPEVHCNKLTWQCTNHQLIKKYIFAFGFCSAIPIYYISVYWSVCCLTNPVFFLNQVNIITTAWHRINLRKKSFRIASSGSPTIIPNKR